jgi:hypothetical protein
MDQVIGDRDCGNAGINQGPGGFAESIKSRRRGGIRCRNQLIKLCLNQGLAGIGIVSDGAHAGDQRNNYHNHPLLPASIAHGSILNKVSSDCNTFQLS